jgi:hypothetical protein
MQKKKKPIFLLHYQFWSSHFQFFNKQQNKIIFLQNQASIECQNIFFDTTITS